MNLILYAMSPYKLINFRDKLGAIKKVMAIFKAVAASLINYFIDDSRWHNKNLNKD